MGLSIRHKLSMKWDKQINGLVLQAPKGQETKLDAALLSGIFTEEAIVELKNLGYDLKTLKFSISPVLGNQRFESQRRKNEQS